jgi:hypothetical protein
MKMKRRPDPGPEEELQAGRNSGTNGAGDIHPS